MDTARPRVVLLGASNLIMALPRVVSAVRHVVAGPFDLLVAAGHGRSYGSRSRVVARGLEGIAECGLWPALEVAEPTSTTMALLTDIGNDVAYGFSPAVIESWVETCLQRLQRARAKTVVTRLPLQTIRHMGPLRFHVVKAVLFPTRPVTRLQVLDRAEELDGRLVRLGERYGCRSLTPSPEWFGFDGIHIGSRALPQAWGEIVATLFGKRATAAQGRTDLPSTAPELVTWFGRSMHHPQPASVLADGSTVSLY